MENKIAPSIKIRSVGPGFCYKKNAGGTHEQIILYPNRETFFVNKKPTLKKWEDHLNPEFKSAYIRLVNGVI